MEQPGDEQAAVRLHADGLHVHLQLVRGEEMCGRASQLRPVGSKRDVCLEPILHGTHLQVSN